MSRVPPERPEPEPAGAQSQRWGARSDRREEPTEGVLRWLLDADAEAVDLLASKRDADGRLPLEACYPGAMPLELGEEAGLPSRWITLHAMRVLDWYAAGAR